MDEFIHYTLIPPQNRMVSVALKVEVNILHIAMVPVIVPQAFIALSLSSRSLHALVRDLNALVVKQVYYSASQRQQVHSPS